MNQPKVALVHDDLVQWGGAERVLLAITELFPEAPIFTSVVDFNNSELKQNFSSKKINTSFLQKIPGWKYFYRSFLPLYPIAFEQFDFSDYDLVISQTTKFAKGIITKPQTKHVCYCHTPPRFLWHFSGETVPNLIKPYLSLLRLYDQIISKRVDTWLAGSKNCQKRLEKIYQTESLVLQPFVDLERFKDSKSFNGEYYLIIARLNNYKKVDMAVKAFNQNGQKLKIVGVGPEMNNLQQTASQNIEFLGGVSETMLNNLLLGCKALIVTAEEDFGLTPLEAQACGKPVVAFGKGGGLETVENLKTGVLFSKQTSESLNQAIERLEQLSINPEECRKNAQIFSKENFKKNFLQAIGIMKT